MNNQNRIRKVVHVLLWVAAVPLLVVGLKYWQWERTLYVDETGRGFFVPLGSSAYAKVLEVVYLPAKAVVQPIARHLSFGGVAIDFASDLLSVVLQHVGLLVLWSAWQAHRLRKSSSSASARNET
jgi:cytochrome c oxidase assembly factor CtaG